MKTASRPEKSPPERKSIMDIVASSHAFTNLIIEVAVCELPSSSYVKCPRLEGGEHTESRGRRGEFSYEGIVTKKQVCVLAFGLS